MVSLNVLELVCELRITLSTDTLILFAIES